MPFGPISVNSKTFNAQGEGRYGLSTLTFGDPSNHFVVRGGQLNKDKSAYTAACTRVLQKDVTVGSATQRLQASVQLVITVPKSGFTSTEIDDLTSDINAFITGAILDRILSGES
jgi:hypothetical protein